AIEEMAKSRLFDIVGHLDLIKIFKYMPKRDVKEIAKNALLAIKEADMSIEINVAGFRKPIGEAYPSLALLKEIKKLDIPITFASDAHKPEQVGLYSDKVLDMTKSVGYGECALYRKRKRKFIKF
ncbi:MAG: histidinol-phosphatase family, partial [Campylobacterota bacterium]|nr:histidinol-phosphatase family [Campylobacterota bacterium]